MTKKQQWTNLIFIVHPLNIPYILHYQYIMNYFTLYINFNIILVHILTSYNQTLKKRSNGYD